MDYLAVFIEMLQARNLADNTIRNYLTYIKQYLNYLSALQVLPEDASWPIVRGFLSWIQKERNLSDRTVNMVFLDLCHPYALESFPGSLS